MVQERFLIPDSIEDVHNKYFIQEGDTFKSVALDLGIEWQILRTYHNTHCINEADMVHAYFPNHLKFIFLQPKLQPNREPEAVPLKEAFFANGFSVPFQQLKEKRNYAVRYTIEDGNEVHTLKYEAGVKWIDTDINGYSFFKIDRLSKVYIDDNEANTIVNELAEKVSSILYPLQVVVDQEGEWVDIHNFEEIKERWETKEAQILKDYPGEETEKYLVLYEENLISNQTLSLALSKDWFLRAFFNGVHTGYTSELTFEGYAYFPFIAKSEDLMFDIKQKIGKYLDENHLINIDIKGVLKNNRTKADFQYTIDLYNHPFGNQKVTGSYRAKYYLNPNNYSIETLFIECDFALDVPQKYTVMVTNLNLKPN